MTVPVALAQFLLQILVKVAASGTMQQILVQCNGSWQNVMVPGTMLWFLVQCYGSRYNVMVPSTM